MAITHDSVVLRSFDRTVRRKRRYADRAYTGEEIEGMLKELNIENQVCEKGRRGAPLSETQGRHSRQMSKIRDLSRKRHRFYRELHGWKLSTVYRSQMGQMSDRIGQPNLQYLPLCTTGSPELCLLRITYEKTIIKA